MSLKRKCPLCYESNPAFGEQRCVHCDMLMMSDQDYQTLIEDAQPIVEKMEMDIEAVRKGQHEQERINRLMELSENLHPFLDRLAFLKDYVLGMKAELQPFRVIAGKRKMLRLNYMILVLLILFPVLSLFFSKGWMVPVLLSLPAIGWFFLGIWGLHQSK